MPAATAERLRRLDLRAPPLSVCSRLVTPLCFPSRRLPHPLAAPHKPTLPNNNNNAAGVLDCARKTVQWEGLGGLYKGVASPLAGQMFFRASLFGAFGSSKRWLATDADGSARPLRTADFYKAGAMTGFVAAFTEGPIDFYKSQIQVQIIRAKTVPDYVPPYTTVGACVRATLKENGFRGPFQGLGATLLRNTPANAVYLGTFEVLKRAAAERMGVPATELPAWTVLSAAGLGGICYWAVIFPVDCVKSAMQTDAIVRSQRRFTDMATTAKVGGRLCFCCLSFLCLLRLWRANWALRLTTTAVTTTLNTHTHNHNTSTTSTHDDINSCCGPRAAPSASTAASRRASSARRPPTRRCSSPSTASRRCSRRRRRRRRE